MGAEGFRLFSAKAGLGEVEPLETEYHVPVPVEEPDDLLYHGRFTRHVGVVYHGRAQPELQIFDALGFEYLQGMDHQRVEDPCSEFSAEPGYVGSIPGHPIAVVDRVEIDESDELIPLVCIELSRALLIVHVHWADKECDLAVLDPAGLEPFVGERAAGIPPQCLVDDNALFLCMVQRCSYDLLLFPLQVPRRDIHVYLNPKLCAVISEFLVQEPGNALRYLDKAGLFAVF